MASTYVLLTLETDCPDINDENTIDVEFACLVEFGPEGATKSTIESAFWIDMGAEDMEVPLSSISDTDKKYILNMAENKVNEDLARYLEDAGVAEAEHARESREGL